MQTAADHPSLRCSICGDRGLAGKTLRRDFVLAAQRPPEAQRILVKYIMFLDSYRVARQPTKVRACGAADQSRAEKLPL
jgi:hypothetical protein